LHRSKFLSDEWMITRNFFQVVKKDSDPDWFHKTIADLGSLLKPHDFNFIDEDTTITKALEIMRAKSIDCMLSFNKEK
jgi:hypothetical protein